MKIEGSFTLQAPVNAVWDYLLNIEEMSQCIPGVDSLETLDANTYRGNLQVKVGPIKAAFGGTVTLLEIEPPHRLVAAIQADDRRNASQVKATFTSRLTPITDGTEVAYTIDASVRGRLAQFGQAVAQSTAKKMAGAFGRCIQEKIDAGDLP